MIKHRLVFMLALILSLAFPLLTHAAEVKNESARQEGNRMVFQYDLVGTEADATVSITLTVEGKQYNAKDLHLEGALGTVKPGQAKMIYWNVLQDFPRGYRGEIEADISTGGVAIGGMVFVKGGCYQMGDTFGDGGSDEKPVHEVCVDDFYIGKYEVTQDQWRKVMGNNPSNFSSCGGNCPVEQVSWNDVQDFIRQLNSQTGKAYRLPTEAEWEYAARSGGKSEKYSGGNDIDSVAWYGSNSGSKTHPVGQKRANGLGIYDMSGNVWEWVQDIFSDSAYRSHSKNNPIYTGSGARRVLRGGSWGSDPRYVRAALRGRDTPDVRRSVLGFRLARTK